MPWVADARLTTSSDAYTNWWGSITGKWCAEHDASIFSAFMVGIVFNVKHDK